MSRKFSTNPLFMNNNDGLNDNLSNQLKALGIDSGMMGGAMMNPYAQYGGMMNPMMNMNPIGWGLRYMNNIEHNVL